jgi:hypothetical protein
MMVAAACGAGCADAAPSAPPAGCDGIALRVVLGPMPLRPGARVRVYATSPGAPPVDATTDAQGAVCLRAAPARGPWDVTLIHPGHALVTLAGVTQSSVSAPVRLDPFIDAAAQGKADVTGHIAGRSTPRANVQVDGVEFDTLVTRADAFRSRYLAASPAPLVLSAIELDANGDAVNGALVSLARPADGAQVDLMLPSPARAPRTVTATLVLPTAGVFTGFTAVTDPPAVTQVHPSTVDGASVYVGTARLLEPTATGVAALLRVFDGDLAPSFATVGLDHAASGLRLSVNVHDLAADSTLTVAPVAALGVTGAALSALRMSFDAPGYAAVLVVTRQQEITPCWRVIAADPAARELRLPALPPGLALADHRLDQAPLFAQGLLMHMHAGAAWSAQSSNQRVPETGYTIGSRFQGVTPDL